MCFAQASRRPEAIERKSRRRPWPRSGDLVTHVSGSYTQMDGYAPSRRERSVIKPWEMVVELTFKNLGATDEQIAKAERFGIRYKKYQKIALKRAAMVPLPSDKVVDDFEKSIQANLPDDYKKFLKSYNGGVPSKKMLPDDRVVNCFLALASPPGFYDSIQNYISVYENRILNKTIPVASAGGGDVILLSVGEDDAGKIYY